MAIIGLLHTSDTHRLVFEALAAEIDATTRTVTIVDQTLLDDARDAGPKDARVVDGLQLRLAELAARGAGRILCTCSTIGGVAETVGADLGVEVVRVDRAMAERAVATGRRIVVLAALDSTVPPTLDLIESVAGAQGIVVDLRSALVTDAWQRFEANDLPGYHVLVADAIARVGNDCDVVVLAQASMAEAAESVDVPAEVLSSPRLALLSLLDVA